MDHDDKNRDLHVGILINCYGGSDVWMACSCPFVQSVDTLPASAYLSGLYLMVTAERESKSVVGCG